MHGKTAGVISHEKPGVGIFPIGRRRLIGHQSVPSLLLKMTLSCPGFALSVFGERSTGPMSLPKSDRSSPPVCVLLFIMNFGVDLVDLEPHALCAGCGDV